MFLSRPEFVDYMIRQCLECSARAASAFLLAGFTTDFRAELQSITVPTLIIHGDHDIQAPLEICGIRTARLVPRSNMVIYENAAHGLFVTHAERLMADLLAFVHGGLREQEVEAEMNTSSVAG